MRQMVEGRGSSEDRLEFGTGLRTRLERLGTLERAGRIKLDVANGAEYCIVQPMLEIVRQPADDDFEGDAFTHLLDMTRTVDGRENLDLQHSRAIARLSRRLATALGLDDDAVRRAYLAGMFHDLGKIELPEKLLRKPGPLDEREWVEMASHAERGAELVDRIGGLSDVAWIVAAHHERWDGVGYPRRIGGADIPVEARIVGASDAFVTMTSVRPFRGALSSSGALMEMIRNAGASFDPSVVGALLSVTLGEVEQAEQRLIA